MIDFSDPSQRDARLDDIVGGRLIPGEEVTKQIARELRDLLRIEAWREYMRDQRLPRPTFPYPSFVKPGAVEVPSVPWEKKVESR